MLQAAIRFFYFSVLIALFSPVGARAGEVKLTDKGFLIDAGSAGTYILTYPKLSTQVDKGTVFSSVTVKPDGSGAVLSYEPTGQVTIDRQPDGSWLYHGTKLAPDVTKFMFGVWFPVSIYDAGATWAFDQDVSKPFPEKPSHRWATGNPKSFTYKMKGSGFTISYPEKTYNMLSDYRLYQKEKFNLGLVLYFPNITTGEKTYHLKIDILPETTPAASSPTTTLPVPAKS